jgi:hypothetical protein
LQQLQMLRRFQAVHARHANIQQQHIRLLGCAQLQCFMAIGRFTADLTAADVGQHCPQSRARRYFVINNQYFHLTIISGKRSVTE